MNEDRFDEGYTAGGQAGYDNGYSDGHDDGLLEAASNPIVASDSELFAAGYKTGVADTKRLPQETYQEGWDAGYNKGYEDRENEVV